MLTSFLRSTVGVLYQDDELIVLNKPEDLLSHPNPKPKNKKDEASILKAPYDFTSESFLLPTEPKQKLFLLHRLDRDTSGILLCAFKPKVAEILKDHFKNHKIKKTYTALLVGKVFPPSDEWKDLIEPPHKKKSFGGGPPNAFTHCKVIQFYKGAHTTLVEFSPKTGKTHQLRIQSSKRHWPIVGDRTYGNFTENKRFAQHYGIKRMFLHATEIEFFHPTLQKKMKWVAPLPEVLQNSLNLLQ